MLYKNVFIYVRVTIFNRHIMISLFAEKVNTETIIEL